MVAPAPSSSALLWTVFGLTYVGLALGRLPWLVMDRTAIAVCGGVLMLVVAGMNPDAARAMIDIDTLMLLGGLMVFSAQLDRSGFYNAAGKLITRFGGRPLLLLALTVAVSGGLSALLTNDVVCLAITPIFCRALLAGRRDPIPYLLAVAAASNIGSAMTLIGNPQVIYIGSITGMRFGPYVLRAALPSLIGLGVAWGLVAFSFRRTLWAASPSPDVVLPDTARVDVWLAAKAAGLLVAAVVCFLLVPPEWRAMVAVLGAALLLISRRPAARDLLTDIDYKLLVMFIGLFWVNGVMKGTGLSNDLLRPVSAHISLSNPWSVAALTAALSNLVSNVPAVLLLEPAIPHADHTTWTLVAITSTFAGNLTLVGSIANLIVAEQARKQGVVLDLKTYCRVGIPLTLITLLLAVLLAG